MMDALSSFFTNSLLAGYFVSGNIGVSILILTFLINAILWPLNKKTLGLAQKQKDLKPQLDKLKEKYGKDKKKLGEEQMKLFKENGVNPAAGCLPVILQMIVFIALFQTFNGAFKSEDVLSWLNSKAYFPALQIMADGFTTNFLWLHLGSPERISLAGFSIPGLMTWFCVLLTYISAKLMLPEAEAGEKLAKKTEQGADDIAAEMQKQMVFMMPLMFLIFISQSPAALGVYYTLNSLITVIRTLAFNNELNKKGWDKILKALYLKSKKVT